MDCTKGIADVDCATGFRAGIKRNVSIAHSAFLNDHGHELNTLTLTMLPVMLFAQVYGINTYLTSVATVCVRKQLAVQGPACGNYLCALKQRATQLFT